MSLTTPKVVYWNNIPAPYIVERFNALARRGNLDFEAWFSARTESDRSWNVDERTWRFPYRYLPIARIGKWELALPTPLLGRMPPELLVSLHARPSFLLGWWLARRRGIRTAFTAEITFDSWVRRRAWKETIKHHIFQRVDGVITFGADSRRTFQRYGAPDDRIHYTVNSVDVDYFMGRREQANAKRDATRRDLNLHGVTFIYTGRFWRGKGLDYLLEAFARLQARCESEISLLLVGRGPEQARLQARCRTEHVRNVTFMDFQMKDALAQLYAAADIFVFPTLGDPYGLAVDEAMACSLPVVSTSAAGEMRDRIEEGVNGYIVPPADPAALLDRMKLLAADETLRQHMGQASARKMKTGHTPEQWAEDFERAVARILGMPRAHGGAR